MRHILCTMLPSVVLAACGGRSYVTVAPEAPPSPRLADVLFEPRDGQIWIEGHFARSGTQWHWLEGRWVAERPGQVWRDGQWEQRGSRWQWIEGEWMPARSGHVRVRGHWERRGDRLSWIPGYWQKERPGDKWEPGRWQPFGDEWIWRVGRWRGAAEKDRPRAVTDRTRKSRHR